MENQIVIVVHKNRLILTKKAVLLTVCFYLCLPFTVLAGGGFTITETENTSKSNYSTALTNLKGDISPSAGFIMDMIDQLMILVLSGGIIYIAITLIGSQSVNKSIVLSWLTGIVVWMLIRVILGFSTS